MIQSCVQIIAVMEHLYQDGLFLTSVVCGSSSVVCGSKDRRAGRCRPCVDRLLHLA